MAVEYYLNEPCKIFCTHSPLNPSGKIIKVSPDYIYVENTDETLIGFSTYYGAYDFKGRIKKSDISSIDYENPNPVAMPVSVKETKHKKDLKPIKISKDLITDFGDRYCVEERQEVYFMAYATDPNTRMSVLWSDLKWLRRHFGVEIFNENGLLTLESVNHDRKFNLNKYKLAIKLKVDTESLKYYNPETKDFGVKANPNYGKPYSEEDWKEVTKKFNLNGVKPNQIGNIDLRKEVPRIPKPLTKANREILQAEIDKGLYVICKYV